MGSVNCKACSSTKTADDMNGRCLKMINDLVSQLKLFYTKRCLGQPYHWLLLTLFDVIILRLKLLAVLFKLKSTIVGVAL